MVCNMSALRQPSWEIKEWEQATFLLHLSGRRIIHLTELQTFVICDNTVSIFVFKKKVAEKTHTDMWINPDSVLVLRMNFAWYLDSRQAIVADHTINILICLEDTQPTTKLLCFLGLGYIFDICNMIIFLCHCSLGPI